jgi:hypothetical protein
VGFWGRYCENEEIIMSDYDICQAVVERLTAQIMTLETEREEARKNILMVWDRWRLAFDTMADECDRLRSEILQLKLYGERRRGDHHY